MKLLLLLLLPLGCFAQNQSPSTFYAYNITKTAYDNTTKDSTFTSNHGDIELTATHLTIDGVTYNIASKQDFGQDDYNFWTSLLTMTDGTLATVIRYPHYFIKNIVLQGNGAYKIYYIR